MKTVPTNAGSSKSHREPLMGFLCPECGSWRTEVWETHDGEALYLWCFACSSRVKVNPKTIRSVHDADGRNAEKV